MKKLSPFKLFLFAPTLILTSCGYGLKEVYKGVPYCSADYFENYFNEWDSSINPYASNNKIKETTELVEINDSHKPFRALEDDNFKQLDTGWPTYNYVYDKTEPTDGTKAYGPAVKLSNYDNSFKYGVVSKMFDGQMFCNGDFQNSRTQVEPSNDDETKGFGVLFSKECNDASYFMMNFKCSMITKESQNLSSGKSDLELTISFVLKTDSGYKYVPVRSTVNSVPTNSGDDHDETRPENVRFKGRLDSYVCFGFSVKDLNLSRLIGFTLQYKLLSDTISPKYPEEKTYHAIMLYEVSFPHTTWH